MPRSRLIVLILLAGAAVLCTALGVWQTRRLFERRAINTVLVAKRERSLVALPSTLPDDSLVERRVLAGGRYDRAHEFVIRGHVYNEIPGVQLVTPLVPDSGPAVLVLRGFAPAINGIDPDSNDLDEFGPITLTGLARPIVALGDSGQPLRRELGTTYRYLDFDAVTAALPYPVHRFVVQRTGPPTGWPRSSEAAPLNDGPHINYMIQWYSMAVISVATLGVILFKKPAPPAPP
jgi:cytochrome oxidase assembly protein ShyY1